MKKTLFAFLVFMLANIPSAFAQVGINNDGSNAHLSAMLDVKSTNKGFLVPRMTTSQRNSINAPAEGLLIYNTSTHNFNFYSDGSWKDIWMGDTPPYATFSIGTGGSCANTSVSGNYWPGSILDSSHQVSIEVNVTTTGSWSILTNTVNGYSFSGSGVFNTTGTTHVILTGSGSPVGAQTDYFTATASNGGGTCSFSVTVSPPPAFSCGGQLTDVRDGQTYNTVQIGSQCWMAENLNIGGMINHSYTQTNNGAYDKYCTLHRKEHFNK